MATGGLALHVLEIGEVTEYIKQLMDYDELLADLWVHGEISNLSRAASGHVYFSLKDGASQLRCAFFRSAHRRPPTNLANGDSVLAHGRISFYEAQGHCQLYVDSVQPEGAGISFLQFEALRARLEAEGLFAQERKRPLPAYPERIGLVTSPTGAVLHDFLTVMQRRYPLAEVVVVPSAVQGEAAPAELVAALETLARFHDSGNRLDLVVLARGGGSMEDLAAFNNEGLARAIFACPVPVVSAIGHETDFTIADYVSDLRAPTPSAAAELVAPNLIECRMHLSEDRRRLISAMQEGLEALSSALEQSRSRLERRSPDRWVEERRRAVDDLVSRGHVALAHRLQITRERLRGSALQIEALSPLQILGRGYSVCTDVTRGVIVRTPEDAEPGDCLEIRVRGGLVDARVSSREHLSLGSGGKSARDPRPLPGQLEERVK